MSIRAFDILLLPFLLLVTTYAFSQEKIVDIIILKEYKIIGNKVTKENIITREIPININDTINKKKLEEIIQRTKSNLLNTSLFNFVTVEPVFFDEEHISLYITVEERWYWWPSPIFDVEETNLNTWWLDKDFDRVNYGLYLAKKNFRGRKETVVILAQGGYTERLGFKYTIPYINKKKTNGLGLKFSYSRNHEVTYGTTDNLRDYYNSGSEYVKKEINANIGYELRPKLYNKHTFSVEYTGISVADSVLYFNKNFLTNGDNSIKFLSIDYTVKRDKRDNKNYPTEGYYYDLSLNKDGIGILGDKLNSFYVTSQFKKYWNLTDRVYLAGSLKGKFEIKESPYFLNTGLGFRNNLVRGYEFYVINSNHYALFKSQLGFALLKNKIIKINAIPAKKFNKIPLAIYMSTFFDAGYVDSKLNTANNFLDNSTLFGGGVSMDFVSYYDLVFRVEYSINKLNEKGLFLHFIAPI